MSLSASVGSVIFAFRRRARLTQTEVARRLGVDVSSVSRWERGEQAPSLAMLENVMVQLGIPPQALVQSFADFLREQGVTVLAPDAVGGLEVVGAANGQNIYAGPEVRRQVGDVFDLQGSAAIQVETNTLEPHAAEGDLLVVRGWWEAKPGEVMLVRVGGELKLKRLRPDRHFESIRSASLLDAEDVMPLARVLFIIRRPR